MKSSEYESHSDEDDIVSDDAEGLENTSSDNNSEAEDSDSQLQEAFAKGNIKPGLNKVTGISRKKKDFINNVVGLQRKLGELSTELGWIERLDLSNEPAPLNPELALQEDAHEKRRAAKLQKSKINVEDDPIHNDFKRELLFYRQAQKAVLESIPRLHAMNVKTRRPEDYFAQMAKTDDHMDKIKKTLLRKKVAMEKSEKARKLRDLKKYGKKVQIEAKLEKQKKKRQVMEEIKKYKKGQTDSLDFLENKKGPRKREGKSNKNGLDRQMKKDKKFGFGGQKKRGKYNTADSAATWESKSGRKSFKGGKKQVRLGKNRRQKMKQRKK